MRKTARLVQPVTKPAPAPVEVIRPACPEVWTLALTLAGGEVSRLRVLADGSVLVMNGPARRRAVAS